MSIFNSIAKVPELRKRLLLTLGLLAVYRAGIFVTTPGVDRNAMKQIVRDQSGTFLGMFNLFSGGALEQLSIFALGIMPYVSASIIFQLMSVVVKQLEELRKEGEAGQRKLNQYTRYATIAISLAQSLGIAFFLENQNESSTHGDVVATPGWPFRLLTMVALTTGTAFLMWLGEQIQERGVGNGISLIIFAGIVADLPRAARNTAAQVKTGNLAPVSLLLLTFVVVVVVAVIVYFERAQRRLPIQYAKRMIGKRVYGGQSSHLPLRVNASGVIPPIFASSLLMFPLTLANMKVPGMEWLQAQLSFGSAGYNVVYASLIVFFCFFYTAVTFQPVEVAENLKKQNAFIPGIRPGRSTAEYIDSVMTRITVGGALYVAAVCTVPTLLSQQWRVPFSFGGTSIMIVVGVALDTVQQIESYLITRHYEGVSEAKATGLRGRAA